MLKKQNQFIFKKSIDIMYKILFYYENEYNIMKRYIKFIYSTCTHPTSLQAHRFPRTLSKLCILIKLQQTNIRYCFLKIADARWYTIWPNNSIGIFNRNSSIKGRLFFLIPILPDHKPLLTQSIMAVVAAASKVP